MLLVRYDKPSSYNVSGHLQRLVVDNINSFGQLFWDYSQKMPGSPTAKFFDAMKMWHGMGAVDQADFEKFVGGKEMGNTVKLIACLPPQVAFMLHEQMPGFTAPDRKHEFYKWLKRPENAGYRNPKIKW